MIGEVAEAVSAAAGAGPAEAEPAVHGNDAKEAVASYRSRKDQESDPGGRASDVGGNLRIGRAILLGEYRQSREQGICKDGRRPHKRSQRRALLCGAFTSK